MPHIYVKPINFIRFFRPNALLVAADNAKLELLLSSIVQYNYVIVEHVLCFYARLFAAFLASVIALAIKNPQVCPTFCKTRSFFIALIFTFDLNTEISTQ